MSISGPSARLRRVAASTGALALAGTLALSGVVGGGVEMTAAAWQDTEVAQAQVVAEWANGGWAKSTTSAYTDYDSFSERPVSGSVVRDTGTTRESSSPGGFNQSYTDIGTANFGPMSSLWSSEELRNAMRGCGAAAAPLVSLTVENCSGGTPYPNSGSQTRARSHGRSAVIANPSWRINNPISWILASEASTRAECRADGTSFAQVPVAGSSDSNVIRLRASSDLLGGYSQYDTLIAPKVNTTITGWVRPKYRASGDLTEHIWRYSVTSRSFTAPGWALSDLFVQVDIYRINDQKHMGTHESVIARSECAVTTPSRTRTTVTPTFSTYLPPSYPTAGLPGTIETVLANPVTGEFSQIAEPAQPMALRAASPITATTSSPPTITVTSPLENSSTSETTTSAPPNPSDEEQATVAGTSAAAPTSTLTSTEHTVSAVPASTATPPATKTTSAAPSTVIPTDPGTLSATALTETVGIVEVDGTATDVVVKGSAAPADSRTSEQALDTWINEGTRLAGDWKTFTSTDPDSDGWRWAAINQETGTVVYVR